MKTNGFSFCDDSYGGVSSSCASPFYVFSFSFRKA